MIQCIKLGDYEFAADYIYSNHSHQHMEIDYVLNGRGMITFPDANITLHAGECIIILSNISHGFIVDGNQSCCIRQFEFDGPIEQSEVSSMLSGIEPSYYKFTGCEEISLCLWQLHQYSLHTDKYQKELFSLEFRKLLILLLRYRKKAEMEMQYAHSHIVKQVLQILTENYCREIDLEQLAKDFYISSSYLRRIFFKEIGFSAMDYITMLRMEQAKRLLKDSSLSVSEIAARIGYSSLPFFSSQFKHKIGLTPTTFRQQSKQLRKDQTL